MTLRSFTTRCVAYIHALCSDLTRICRLQNEPILNKIVLCLLVIVVVTGYHIGKLKVVEGDARAYTSTLVQNR